MGEVRFYQTFFDECTVCVEGSHELLEKSFEEAVASGLSAMDALHVIAAAAASVDELVTVEKLTKPIYRTQLVRVVPVR